MRTKRVIALVVAILSILCVFSGCGNNASKETTGNNIELSKPNEFPIVKEPATLSLFAPKSPYIENFETNEFTKWYEEKTGIKLEWHIASGDSTQALNLMIASGDYPDIIMGAGLNKAARLKYAKEGILVDIKDTINTHGYYIKEMFEKSPEVEKGVTIDGCIYGLPSVDNEWSDQYLDMMWVYKPWLEKLNIEKPETTEEFYEMLKAFKEKDPNGNGIADEIPLTARGAMYDPGIRNYIMSAFIPQGGTGWYHENGKVKLAVTEPEYREGLRYFKRLYDEGLLYEDTFILDRTQVVAIGESDPAILGCAPGMYRGMFTVANAGEDRFYEFTAIPPLEGPNGVRSTVANKDSYYAEFCVTSACENPAMAVKWIDWFYSAEGKKISQTDFSEGGLRDAKEGELAPDGSQALWAIDKVEETAEAQTGMSQNRNWKQFGVEYSNLETSLKTCDYTNFSNRDGEQFAAYLAYKPYAVDNFLADMPTPPEYADEYMDIHLNIETAISTWFAKFVTGEASIDDDWDEYLDYLDGFGMERYLEILQESYELMDK